MQALSNYQSTQNNQHTAILMTSELMPKTKESEENKSASFLPSRNIGTLIMTAMPASVFVSLFIASEANSSSPYSWLLISAVATSLTLLSVASLQNSDDATTLSREEKEALVFARF